MHSAQRPLILKRAVPPQRSTSAASSVPIELEDTAGGNVQAEQHAKSPAVRWGIHWRAPTAMIGFFLAGIALAAGHFKYYDYLDGKEVFNVDSGWWTADAIRSSQEWKIRFGTAFAFATKTAFAGAVVAAYNQRLYVSTKDSAITVEGLDALFAATNDIFSFTSLDFISNAKLAAMLAALAWYVHSA